MSVLNNLFDENGTRIELGNRLGSPGGEGTVYEISNRSGFAAKIYHTKPSSVTIEKLRAMIGFTSKRLQEISAWPSFLLFENKSSNPIGFAMPRIADFHEIWHLYNPSERLTVFPKSGWKFQIRAAANLASAFDEIHSTGCVIGDVQLRNAQVSHHALVKIVDCDSFQVKSNNKIFYCEVGLPHYIPPELQGKSLKSVIRTKNHDLFGLAVLIYQLLFVGRHPYQGIYKGTGEPSFEQLIREFRFCHGPLAKANQMDPPPHTPTFEDITNTLRLLFRRAFEKGSEGDTRPRAIEWVKCLKELENELVVCPNDPGHQYWIGSKSCTWCRIVKNGGPEYYYGSSGKTGHFEIDENTIAAIKNRIKNLTFLEDTYSRSKICNSLGLRPNTYNLEKPENRAETAIIIGLASSLFFTLFILINRPIGIAGIIGFCIFFVLYFLMVKNSPWKKELVSRQKSKTKEFNKLKQTENEYKNGISSSIKKQNHIISKISNAFSKNYSLLEKYQNDIAQLKENLKNHALSRHLSLYSIYDIDIPGIGEGRILALARGNILSAHEVNENTLYHINGFGPILIQKLLNWKQDIINKFKFDEKTFSKSNERLLIANKFNQQQSENIKSICTMVDDLEKFLVFNNRQKQNKLNELKERAKSYMQTCIDLDYLESQ